MQSKFESIKIGLRFFLSYLISNSESKFNLFSFVISINRASFNQNSKVQLKFSKLVLLILFLLPT